MFARIFFCILDVGYINVVVKLKINAAITNAINIPANVQIIILNFFLVCLLVLKEPSKIAYFFHFLYFQIAIVKPIAKPKIKQAKIVVTILLAIFFFKFFLVKFS